MRDGREIRFDVTVADGDEHAVVVTLSTDELEASFPAFAPLVASYWLPGEAFAVALVYGPPARTRQVTITARRPHDPLLDEVVV